MGGGLGSRDANSGDSADLVHQDEDIVHQHEIVQFKLQPSSACVTSLARRNS
jgi:hypothetical protein